MIVICDSTHLQVESVVVVIVVVVVVVVAVVVVVVTVVVDRVLKCFIAVKLSISYRCSLFLTGIDFWVTKLLYSVKFIHFVYKPLRSFSVNALVPRLYSSDL